MSLPSKRTTPKRSQRKPKASLPPALAHEMDILRAARMGIDISYMKPEERCKYPSKFCCHKRVRKSTGKLHRFCEYHRSRANVNQKRWTEIRRQHEDNQEMVENALAVSANDTWRADSVSFLAAVLSQPPAMLPIAVSSLHKHDQELNQQPTSPTHVDALQDGDIPLSEDDIDMLTTIVAESEKCAHLESLCVEDAWLMSMLRDIESPIVSPSVFDELEMNTL